jgi:hypothetical protein
MEKSRDRESQGQKKLERECKRQEELESYRVILLVSVVIPETWTT